MKPIITINRLLIVVCLFLLSCAQSAAISPGHGDNDDTSPKAALGERCSSQSSCPAGADCLLMGANGLRCTKTCEAAEDCAVMGAEWFCRKDNGEFHCVLPDGAADGDPGETDRDADDGACTPDTLHCKDATTLERCALNGRDWLFYRQCPTGRSCAGGLCTEGGCAATVGSECCPGQFRCFFAASQNQTEVQRCDPKGVWQFYRDCDAPKFCLDGVCQNTQGGDQDAAESPEAESEESTPGVPCTVEDGCLSPNEYCFTTNSSEKKGTCTAYCSQAGVRCPRGYRCATEQCAPIPNYCRANENCGFNQYCLIHNGSEDGLCVDYCFAPGFSCHAGSHCNEAQDDPLTYGKCVTDGTCTRCNADTECGDGTYCYKLPGTSSGCCRKMCSKDSCGGGQVCSNGRCQGGTDLLDCTFPCSAGYTCDRQYGQCVLDCPPCDMAQGYYCDATTGRQCKYDPNHCFLNPPIFCGLGLANCCPGKTCTPVVEGLWGYCI